MEKSFNQKLLKEKNIVVITSSGRTGTAFFGNRLSSVIDDTFSVHEPDLFKFSRKDLIEKSRNFGFKHIFYNRFIRDIGIRQLSERNLGSDSLNYEYVEVISKLRLKYYSNIDQSLIIESYPVWYGLIEEIHETFQNVKVVSVVRDPREWIRSVINRNSYYGKHDWSSSLKSQRLDPYLINDEEYMNRWNDMNWIEKLAWYWKTVYGEVRKQEEQKRTLVFRFEDLFLSDNEQVFLQLLDEITTWPEKSYPYNVPEGFLKKKVNVNFTYEYPEWEKWSEDDKENVLNICGDLLNVYGYES